MESPMLVLWSDCSRRAARRPKTRLKPGFPRRRLGKAQVGGSIPPCGSSYWHSRSAYPRSTARNKKNLRMGKSERGDRGVLE